MLPVRNLWRGARNRHRRAGRHGSWECVGHRVLAGADGRHARSADGRLYTLHVPGQLTGDQVPLLVSLHGRGASPEGQENQTGWSRFADANNLIVAYPAGIGDTWRPQRGSPDVEFLREVVADVSRHWCVDPRRVYADGHSYGATMSQRLACDAASTFAAVVEYAGWSPGDCDPSRPISVGLFHGDFDLTIAIAEGARARDEWVTRNHCSPSPQPEPEGDGDVVATVDKARREPARETAQ